MTLLVVGINHKSASVAFREKLAFNPEQMHHALAEAQHVLGVEMVIVSTCNRSEIYCQLNDSSAERVLQWLASYKQVDLHELQICVYQYQQIQAVNHLMRVASGLDSLVLGEPQILGQIKQAYNEAKEVGAVGSTLERLFQKTFSVAKLVRTDTEIGVNAISIAYAAVSLAKQIFGRLDDSRVLLVGAGETIELVMKHLLDQGVQQVIVANRTVSRAKELAQGMEAEAITLNDIPLHLADCDIVISSTASPLPIIGKGMVETAIKKRRFQPMFLVDIAVPRDIEEQVGELRDAYLYSVDDLQGIVAQNMAARRDAAAEAEQIVEQQSAAFMAWLRSLESVATIRDYRSQSEQIRDDLVERAIEALASGKAPEQVLKETAFKLTNKLIHAPCEAINQAGREGRLEELAVVRNAIGLRK